MGNVNQLFIALFVEQPQALPFLPYATLTSDNLFFAK